MIEHGLIKLTCLSLEGRLSVIGLCSRGALLGLSAALLQTPLLTTAETLTRCYLHSIPVDDFCSVIKNEPQACWQLHQLCSHAVQVHALCLVTRKNQSARCRLELLLKELPLSLKPMSGPESARLHVPLKQSELAQLVGVTPEHLSRLLAQLERDGLLQRDGHTFILSEAPVTIDAGHRFTLALQISPEIGKSAKNVT